MNHLIDWIVSHVQSADPGTALLALFIGMALESTCVPLPSEVVLPLAGIWAAPRGALGLIEVELAVIGGTLAGSALMFGVGFWGGYPVVERYGKYFLVNEHHLKSAHSWIERQGGWAIAATRFMFGIRHVSSFVAGVLRMPFTRFMIFTGMGGAAWDTLGVLLGFCLGDRVQKVLKHIGEGAFGLAAVLGVVFIATILVKKSSAVRQVRPTA